MHFYTSVNNHYMAKAIVLAKSVKKYIPSAKFSLVLSDKRLDDFDIKSSPFDEILTIEELNIPVENLNLWTFQHTVVELCTAVKGQALVKFLEEGSEKVVYLDPDIEVFNTLNEIDSLLDKYDVVLTPHQTIPEENYRDIINNEICSLKHGTYNFGFYAVKNSINGLKFAKWWRDRLIDFCYDDIPNGIFTDQKWGDLVPALFDGIYILRSPAYNVSTWNLSHRKIEKKGDIFYVNNEELQFYHFSGFDSGAQKIMLELYADKNSAAFELRDLYIEKQRNAGQEKYVKFYSIYDTYDNGIKISKNERKLLRERRDVYNYFKDINPYIVEQEKSYYKWYLKEIGNEDNEISLKKKIEQRCKFIIMTYFPSSLVNVLRKIVKGY